MEYQFTGTLVPPDVLDFLNKSAGKLDYPEPTLSGITNWQQSIFLLAAAKFNMLYSVLSECAELHMSARQEMSVPAAAAERGVHRSTLYRAAQNGDINIRNAAAGKVVVVDGNWMNWKPTPGARKKRTAKSHP